MAKINPGKSAFKVPKIKAPAMPKLASEKPMRAPKSMPGGKPLMDMGIKAGKSPFGGKRGM